MTWFEAVTGFRENDYETTRSLLRVEGDTLISTVNGRRMQIGHLETPSLGELRARVNALPKPNAPLRFNIEVGDVREMHHRPDFKGALFQVASQFNLLEMVGPSVVPEDGVSGYEYDPTQGPACAIAAGAATIYRNYFAPVEGQFGQTRTRQIDTLGGLGQQLAQGIGIARESLWTMRNGYALCTAEGLRAIDWHLAGVDPSSREQLKDSLRIGLHTDLEVTDGSSGGTQRVSQAFCSALPIEYVGADLGPWERFANLILEAAYDATLNAAALNRSRGQSDIVLLTRLGGGAFGNDGRWIDAAIEHALLRHRESGLDARMVRYGSTPDLSSLT